MKRVTGFPTRPDMVQRYLMLGLIIITCLPVMDLIIGLIMSPMNLP